MTKRVFIEMGIFTERLQVEVSLLYKILFIFIKFNENKIIVKQKILKSNEDLV